MILPTESSTDRELLELAAKAGGWKYDPKNSFDIERVARGICPGLNLLSDGGSSCWNPRTDNGYALSLLCAVWHWDNLNYHTSDILENAMQDIRNALSSGNVEELRNRTFLAAVEIGRSMP